MKIPKDHNLFTAMMRQKLVAKEFFEAHLPDNIKEMVDLSSLKMLEESFIEQDSQNSLVDALFSVNFDNQDGYIYLILDSGPKPDYFISMKIFKSVLDISERHLVLNKNEKKLPTVYPMVIYNGKESYDVPRDFWNLFSHPGLAKKLFMG